MDETEGRNAAKLEILKHYLDQHGALSAALVSFFQSALRTAFLLNGGAIVAVLSAYGARGGTLPLGSVKGALICWIVGLFAAAMSGGVIAWGQREFQVIAGDAFRQQANDLFGLALGKADGTECHALLGRVLRSAFFVLWFLSIAFFGAGAAFAIQGMS